MRFGLLEPIENDPPTGGGGGNFPFPGPPPISSPPQWLLGTWYWTLGNRVLTIDTIGNAVVKIGGNAYVGTYYNGQLLINGDTSDVVQTTGGIRTLNHSSGVYSDYSHTPPVLTYPDTFPDVEPNNPNPSIPPHTTTPVPVVTNPTNTVIPTPIVTGNPTVDNVIQTVQENPVILIAGVGLLIYLLLPSE